MIKKHLFLLFLLILNFSIIVNASELTITHKILIKEAFDAKVVGDFFYYEISLNNTGNVTINDTILVLLFNPKGSLIRSQREFPVYLEPSRNLTISPIGKNETEYFVEEFDTVGDYKIQVISKKGDIEFYRRFTHNNYVRHFGGYNFTFDVMPRWQYDLWKQTEEANKKTIEANDKLLKLNVDLEDLSEDMWIATWIMLFVALMALIIEVFREKPWKKFFDIIAVIFICVILLFIVVRFFGEVGANITAIISAILVVVFFGYKFYKRQTGE